MLLDLLSAAAAAQTPFAAEILERTASTPRVQQVVQLSLAPAFLLSGIGAIMNVIMSRMIWIAKRVENIEDKREEHRTPKQARELGWLMRRRKLPWRRRQRNPRRPRLRQPLLPLRRRCCRNRNDYGRSRSCRRRSCRVALVQRVVSSSPSS